MIIKIIGLIVIAASFVFVLKSPDKSMMDRLLERKRTKVSQAMEKLEETEETEKAGDPDSPEK